MGCVAYYLQTILWSFITQNPQLHWLASPLLSPVTMYPPPLCSIQGVLSFAIPAIPALKSLLPGLPPPLFPVKSFHYYLWDLYHEAMFFRETSQISHFPLLLSSGFSCKFPWHLCIWLSYYNTPLMKVDMAGNRDVLVLDPGIVPLPTHLDTSDILGLCLSSYHLTWCLTSRMSLCTNVWSLIKVTELSHGTSEKKNHYLPTIFPTIPYPSCPVPLPSFGTHFPHAGLHTLMRF